MRHTHTMSDVQAIIDARQRRLTDRALFAALARSSDIEDLRAIAPHSTFYVFGFQDMLRLTHEVVSDPKMRELALSLREDDAGHENWFHQDLRTLGVERDVAWIFGPEHRFTRDMVYRLMRQLLAATDDAVRLAFPLVLESAGTVYFDPTVGLAQRTGWDSRLRYFARSHQAAEEAHQVFSDDGQTALMRLGFTDETFSEAERLVHACFDCFDDFADHLEARRASRTNA